MEITRAIPALGMCRDPASPSWNGLHMGRTAGNSWKKAPLRDSQLLEAAWLLSVLHQWGTAKLPAFAVAEQAAMLWVDRQQRHGAPSRLGSCCALTLAPTAGSGFAPLPAREQPLPASHLYPRTPSASL